MKPYILFLLLLISINNIYSQSTVPGYYITKKQDTIVAQIRSGFSNDFVKIIDSVGGSKKFTPDDINEYGVLYKGIKYSFVSKPMKNGSYKFLSPIITGQKTSLYYYGYTTRQSTYAPIGHEFYTFEKSDGTYLFLRNVLTKKSKNQLKEFYSDNHQVQQLIETKLRYWEDRQNALKEILDTYNEK